MAKSIRVRILGRDYPLIVRDEDEAITREMASFVDAKMQAFKRAHPEQSDLVTAIITSLSLTEELYQTRESQDHILHQFDADLDALDRHLAQALGPGNASAHPEPTPSGDGANAEV